MEGRATMDSTSSHHTSGLPCPNDGDMLWYAVMIEMKYDKKKTLKKNILQSFNF